MFELNDDTKWILCQSDFISNKSTAQALRDCGIEINNNAKSEQANVIYWMLQMYKKYGNGWKEKAVIWIKENCNMAKENYTENICPFCGADLDKMLVTFCKSCGQK